MSEDKQSEDRKELMEIYKLHAELADKTIQRREGVNNLHVSLITGIFVFLGAFVDFEYGTLLTLPIDQAFLPLSFFALVIFLIFVVSVSWLRAVRSYHKYGKAKFDVLSELEEELPYSFFKRESELLKKKKKNKVIAYITFGIFELVQKDTVLPWALYMISYSLIIIIIFLLAFIALWA